MKTSDYKLWIWGLIDKKNEIIINDIRKKISKNVHSPSFPTHITLSGPINYEFNSISIALDKYISNRKKESVPIVLSGLNWKNEQYKFLYLEVNHSKLLNLKKSIDDLFDKDSSNFLPHISLAYSQNFNFDRSKFISMIKEYDIDKLSIIKICIALVNEKKKIWKVKKEFNII